MLAKKFLLILGVFLAFGPLAYAQVRVSSKEISYQYDQTHDFVVNEVAAFEGTQVKVFIEFILNSGNVKMSDYSFSHFLKKNYIDEGGIGNKVQLDSSHIIDIGFRKYVFEFELVRELDDNLIVFEIYDRVREKQYYLDIPLRIGAWKRPPFVLMQVDQEIPYFGKYLPVGAALRPVHQFNESVSFQISGVLNESGVPLPPFEEEGGRTTSITPIDTLYGVKHNEVFRFQNEGFFKVNTSESSDLSLPLLITDDYYPYFQAYEDLVEPLIFISTNEEYEKMKTTEFPRDAFEGFVNLTISTNEMVSRGFIKNYFKRVRESARLFTTDREGWKTDRGMIYQIFGRPQQVFRNETTELWVYTSPNGRRTRYIYDIIPTKEGLVYKLIRGKRYREDWMQAVTQWRTGRVFE